MTAAPSPRRASASALLLLATGTAAAGAGACRGAARQPASPPPPSVSAPAAIAAATRPAPATGAAAATDSTTAARAPRRGYSTADVRFMQHMIGHHAQALAMTALLPSRARRDDLRLLAERIEISQRDEIAMMRRWLADRGEAAPPAPPAATATGAAPMPAGDSAHAMHHDAAAASSSADGGHDMAAMGGGAAGGTTMMMPGMLTPAEMERLAAASGADFERLFLPFMIRHHEGALTMVAQYLATPGAGQDAAAFRFASDVDADQRAEIARMRALLRTAPSAGAASAAHH